MNGLKMGGGEDSVRGEAFGSLPVQDAQEGFLPAKYATEMARALAARVLLPAQIPAMTWDDLKGAFDRVPHSTWREMADRGQIVLKASSSTASASPSQGPSKLPRNNGAGAAK